jgi:hypothetical protein
MKYDELMKIIYNSQKGDWAFNDERGIYTFKNDLNVRIQKKDIVQDRDQFTSEDWATKNPDKTAYRVTYEIYYGASFVSEKLLVSVDGHRATLPIPEVNTLKVRKEDYAFAKIVDQLDTLADYIQRSGLEVEEG